VPVAASARRRFLKRQPLSSSVIENAVQWGYMADHQIDLLRTALARAYEERQPLHLRLIQAVKDCIGPRTPRKPLIQSLGIIEKNKDAA
jgi:hypothetical protein